MNYFCYFHTDPATQLHRKCANDAEALLWFEKQWRAVQADNHLICNGWLFRGSRGKLIKHVQRTNYEMS